MSGQTLARTSVPRPSGMRFSFLALAVLLGSTAAARSHVELRLEARAAYQRKDYLTAFEAWSEALALRPDSPAYLHNVAAMSARLGDTAGALRNLERLTALGVVTPVERDPDFASLQGSPEFARVVRRLAENREPRGALQVFTELPGRTGILEGIAWHPRTGDVYLSDVHHRVIWRRDREGRVVRFTSEDDEVLGVFGLAIDEKRNSLWAALAAVPEMEGYSAEFKGQGALAEFSLATSELLRVVPVPSDGRDHGLGDLVVTPEGRLYATDSRTPVIWQYAPGDEEMTPLLESADFVSLQGLVLAGDTLIVADYGNGLFAVDLAALRAGRPSAEVLHALAPPQNTTLLGLDGLVAVEDGLVATQNGVAPERVLHVSLTPDHRGVANVRILASGLPELTDVTLLAVVDGRPTVLAGAGWTGYDPAKAPHPAPHTVRLLQPALEAP